MLLSSASQCKVQPPTRFNSTKLFQQTMIKQQAIKVSKSQLKSPFLMLVGLQAAISVKAIFLIHRQIQPLQWPYPSAIRLNFSIKIRSNASNVLIKTKVRATSIQTSVKIAVKSGKEHLTKAMQILCQSLWQLRGSAQIQKPSTFARISTQVSALMTATGTVFISDSSARAGCWALPPLLHY